MKKNRSRLLDLLMARNEKKTSIIFRFSAWHYVVVVGIIGIVVSVFFIFDHKKRKEMVTASGFEKKAESKRTNEIGFIFR